MGPQARLAAPQARQEGAQRDDVRFGVDGGEAEAVVGRRPPRRGGGQAGNRTRVAGDVAVVGVVDAVGHFGERVDAGQR